ncbi:hypothetical protein [Luteolibacter soli]|uniref:Uncharacterized protein n=1 Tax=Luteolibacter soli TaxID=3135280 RepID=A0ABU9B2R3_9BACT
MKDIIQILIIELVILAALARMDRPIHYIAVLVAAFLSFCAYLMIGKGVELFGKDALMLLVPAVIISAAGQVLWCLVRNPAATLDAVDTYMMEESVAKQLARGERGHPAKPSVGNWRVAQEIVRNLKGRDKE